MARRRRADREPFPASPVPRRGPAAACARGDLERVQRADGVDGEWRTLDSRSLHNQRLAVAPVADRILETKLSGLGYVMVPRADGNGAEVGGVGQDATEPTEAQRLAAWEAQAARREVQALSGVHEQVASFAAGQRAAGAPAALDDAARRRAARIAVAEVQKQHAVWSMAQLRFEVHRALPVLEGSIDGPAVVDEVARLAVGGQSGTEVAQVSAPDIADVTGFGVRASDGGSIYRPPNEEHYCTLAHLDVEEQILTAAKRTVPQLVGEQRARAATARTDLKAEQRDAVTMMLTATAATTVLVAPAGAGKSHTIAAFARLWSPDHRHR